FIYEHTRTMLTADPGLGKSTISTQMAIELAAGLPLFGHFRVPQPVKVFYAQTERPLIEILERIDEIGKIYPIIKENLAITGETQKLDLLKPMHVEILIEYIKKSCPGVRICFFDPIYALVSGGLSSDIPASLFTRAMSRIQSELNATFWYTHHTTKPQHSSNGEVIFKTDPFYGSQWLKAHVTGSLHLKATDTGVSLERKKDNYRLLPNYVKLDYDQETGLCSINSKDIPSIEKIRNYINAMGAAEKEFCFNDIEAATQLCSRTIREALLHNTISDLLIVVNTIRRKKIYKKKPS
ncbi:MAG: AAA family ATPase, partial [Gammaproteobacteria bacterium]|nr:AAA family ATPase [Gammaproteobacteria bacterium]